MAMDVMVFNRQIPRVQHHLEWIDAVVLYCSFDSPMTGSPYPDASKDEGGGDGEQTDLAHLAANGGHEVGSLAFIEVI